MKPIKVRDILIGGGPSKIIVPVMDNNKEDILKTLELVKSSHACMIEFRPDCFADPHDQDAIEDALIAARESLGDGYAVMLTFRSVSEGGRCDMDPDEYVSLYERLADTGCVDMMDIEYKIGTSRIKHLTELAKGKGIVTLLSYHDFDKTESCEWMVKYAAWTRDMGADIPKIAMMAEDFSDCLHLMEAAFEITKGDQGPALVMCMGKEGVLTRLAGELYGNAITFASLKDSSAPGQVPVETAYGFMEELHEICVQDNKKSPLKREEAG